MSMLFIICWPVTLHYNKLHMQIHSLKIERASVVLAIKIIFSQVTPTNKEPQNITAHVSSMP